MTLQTDVRTDSRWAGRTDIWPGGFNNIPTFFFEKRGDNNNYRLHVLYFKGTAFVQSDQGLLFINIIYSIHPFCR